MGDFINKIVMVIMTFVLLILAPLLIVYTTNDMKDQRMIMNDATEFLDRVTDKGSVEKTDLNQLYLNLNSYSMVLDAEVKRLVRGAIRVPDETGTFITKTTYFAVDPDANGALVLNAGDVVQLTIKEIGVSTARQLTYQLLKIDNGAFELTLAAGVK